MDDEVVNPRGLRQPDTMCSATLFQIHRRTRFELDNTAFCMPFKSYVKKISDLRIPFYDYWFRKNQKID